MAERKATVEEVRKRATYKEAVTIHGGGQLAEVSESLHQRTVVTSMTHGTVTLRYAPRNPKATQPVDTSC